MSLIPVVDVFAGPGGLNEGFSEVERDGSPVFRIAASFEMESNAIRTLTLRAAVRLLRDDAASYAQYDRMLAGELSFDDFMSLEAVQAAYAQAGPHVHQLELGPSNRAEVARRIRQATEGGDDWVLVGGPPCQAYSLVGRSRRAHDPTFEGDKKHFLYREYLDIIHQFQPAVFVMENVKGLLSAAHRGEGIFERILEDLGMGGLYSIRSFTVEGNDLKPSDFVIRAENHGIPQARHRVILLGVRGDRAHRRTEALDRLGQVTVRQTIGSLPKTHSEVSKTADPEDAWERARALGQSLVERDDSLGLTVLPTVATLAADDLTNWLTKRGAPLSLHEPRRHMELDLARYAYLAGMAQRGLSPRVNDMPRELLPLHANVGTNETPFVDRFKVQHWDRPSSTIASHISKDGHYYIHPDPDQMRSLTVREAARLQTFPDDYFFCGPRTAQFHQVGNAVPPLLAFKIAERVASIFGE